MSSAAKRRLRSIAAVVAPCCLAAGVVVSQPPVTRYEGPPDGLELLGWPNEGPGFAGAETCAACHGGIAEAQAEHPMARSGAALTAATLDRYFPAARVDLPVRWRSESAGAARPAYRRSGAGAALVNQEGRRGLAVHAVFGSGLRGETPVHFTPGGAMRELRVSWSRGLGTWIETPGSESDRDPLGDLDPPEAAADCVGCHATAVRWEDGAPDTTASEWGIRCERCHGPGAAHASGWESGAGGPVFNPGHLTPAGEVAFCAQCHRLPSDIEPLEILRRDRSLVRHAGASLMMSACFREAPGDAAVSCLSCHDAHEHAPGGTDGVAARSQGACLGCHAEPAAAHRYEPVTRASDCLGCHMPRQEEVFPGAAFTDHWIRVRGAPPAPGSPEMESEIAWLEALTRNALAKPQRPRKEARLAIGLGELLQAQGLGESAAESIRRGIALDPDYGRLLKAAAILRQVGEGDAAAQALERAAAMDPEAGQAWFDLGDLRLARGEPEAAVEALERARQTQPEAAVVLGRLGAAYREAGRLDAALDVGRAATARETSGPGALEAWLELGITHRARRETEAAADALRSAYDLDPDWPPVLDALARLRALDPDETVRDTVEAVRLAERLAGFSGYEEPLSLDLLAAVHAAAGDFDFAIRAAERALELLAPEASGGLGNGIRERLALYRSGRAVVEAAPYRRAR